MSTPWYPHETDVTLLQPQVNCCSERPTETDSKSRQIMGMTVHVKSAWDPVWAAQVGPCR